jgi:ABC-type branched-subunit amino acid transport system substrate-binding protein
MDWICSAWVRGAIVAALLLGGPSLRAAWAEEIRLGYLLSRAAGFSTDDRAGARMGEDEVNLQAQVLGRRFRVIFAEGGHSSEVVAQARELIERQGVRALLASVSDAATIALANLAQEHGIVFFNVGSDVDSLRGEKCRRHAFSIGPSLTMRVRALGQWAIQQKEWKAWAVVQGESRSEERLAEAARQYLEAQGGRVVGTVSIGEAEAPDPAGALHSLRGIEADFVYIALTGEKQELFLDAYQKSGIATPVGGAEPELSRMGRHTLRFAGYWSTGWSHQNDIYGASELNNRFADFAGIPMNERAWGAWAGVKILGEAILRAASPAAADLVPYLREHVRFDGYMGTALDFRPWNHQLRQSMTIVRINHDPQWNGWDALTREATVPLRRPKGWTGDPLDSIDLTQEESGCRW